MSVKIELLSVRDQTQAARLAAALGRWADVLQDRQRRHTVMGRVLARMAGDGLAAAFATWRDAVDTCGEVWVF